MHAFISCDVHADAGFKMIIEGEVYDLPEQAFLNVGTIEEAMAKGKALLEQASQQ